MTTTAPRQGPPTIRQVAAAAGVSRATASRVINGGHLVSPQARAAVEAAIAELGFTPNPAARSLATRRTGTVALVVPEPNSRLLTDPFFGGIINGLSLALDDSDLQMVLLIARPGASTERVVRYVTTGHVDGAVVASHHRDDSLNRRLLDADLPLVFIGRALEDPTALHVDLDNTTGARLATEHLISTGRRRIGTIAGPPDMTAGLDRFEGWRGAMEAAGLPTDVVGHGDFTGRSGATVAAALLDAHPDLDALFVASDAMAAGALSVLASRNLLVPDDVAVFGFDDLGVAETTDPPLSTVRQPVSEMASTAGRLLQAVLAGEDPGAPVLFSPQLTLRESA